MASIHPQGSSGSLSTKGVAWSEAELKALIGIWGEADVQAQLDSAVRNKFVFKHIAKEMMKLGCNRDWEQCKTKIKNLKTDYRNVKDNNGKTGRGRKSCKFFNELETILGHRPSSVPIVVLARVFHVVNFVDKNLRHASSLKSIATRVATAFRSFPVWI